MKSKEKRFKELLNNYSIQISIDSFPDKIEFFDENGKWLIDYEKQFLSTYISFDRVWDVFEFEYNMKNSDIKKFIGQQLFNHFKINKNFQVIGSSYEKEEFM